MYLFVVILLKYAAPDIRAGPGYLKFAKPLHLVCQRSLWKFVLYLDNTEELDKIVSVRYLTYLHVQTHIHTYLFKNEHHI